MKIKLTEYCKRDGVAFEKALELLKTRVSPSEVTGKGKNTWITEVALDALEVATVIPLAVPVLMEGRVKNLAPNQNYVICVVKDIGKIPVACKRKSRSLLMGKTIPIHKIEDDKGVSYRHAELTGHSY